VAALSYAAPRSRNLGRSWRPVQTPTAVDQAAALLSRRLHVERRELESRAQRDALAVHYGIEAADLAGLAPAVVELMTLRVRAERVDEREQIAEELRDALTPWLFRIGLEVQGAAILVADKPVADRLGMCAAELDDCRCYIRQLIFARTVPAAEGTEAVKVLRA
jgi:signal transduction histidine kinase